MKYIYVKIAIILFTIFSVSCKTVKIYNSPLGFYTGETWVKYVESQNIYIASNGGLGMNSPILRVKMKMLEKGNVVLHGLIISNMVSSVSYRGCTLILCKRDGFKFYPIDTIKYDQDNFALKFDKFIKKDRYLIIVPPDSFHLIPANNIRYLIKL